MKYNVNATTDMDTLFWRLAPPVAAVLLIVLFVSLGFWQLDRASQKIATRDLFDNTTATAPLVDDMAVSEFQRISATGRFVGERQFLIDNMISNGRVGYYVLTAFEYGPGKPLLIVNRGWVAATSDRSQRPDVSTTDDEIEIRGRAGKLPRVGIRAGEVFADDGSWPMLAVYPDLSDLSRMLGRELLPFVLLLDPDDSQPLVRDWRPRESGPMMHYGYAFQWFALAVAVSGILIWQSRKKRNNERQRA